MAEAKKSLYVGCGLTGAPTKFVQKVESLKENLGDVYNVFDFIGLENGTSEDVYRWDIEHCVRDCDMFVGVCDYPSIGLGWELGEAVRLGKPTLGVAHETSKVTRLVLGAAAVEPVFQFARYQNLVEDIPRLIMSRLVE